MRFAIDVAHLDRTYTHGTYTVIAVRRMLPGRVELPRFRARYVLEAEAGALGRWGVRRGAMVVVRDR